MNVTNDIASVSISDADDAGEIEIARIYRKTPDDSGEVLVWEQPE